VRAVHEFHPVALLRGLTNLAIHFARVDRRRQLPLAVILEERVVVLVHVHAFDVGERHRIGARRPRAAEEVGMKDL
jgi:hypothetical protein